MRRWIASLFRRLAEALVRLYYPARAVEGRERIPAGKPLVFVLNHPNGLLDPMVLRVATGFAARFLAKSTLFRNPLSRLAMDAFGSIPIYRAHESGARGGDASRNDASFARCRAELAAGGAMALFPEGVSHSDPQLRPLKTGAARIALSAEAEHDGRLGVTVVPVGLYYERKALFRSSVLLVVGEPIAVAPLLADYRRDERQTVDGADRDHRRAARRGGAAGGVARSARRDRARGALDAATKVPTTIWRRNTSGRASWPTPTRGCARAIPRASRRSPPRCARYARVLRQLGVRDPWALELAPLRPGALAAAFAKLIVAAPLAALGAVMGWIPYRLAGEVAKRVTRDEDMLGTVKLFAGAAFLAVAWGLEATAAGCRWGAGWARADVRRRRRERIRRAALRGAAARGGRSVAARRAARVSPPDDAAAGRAPPRARRRGRQRPARRRRGANVRDRDRDASLDARSRR